MSSKVQLILKRLIDILLSLMGLVLLTVSFAIIALVIKLNSKAHISHPQMDLFSIFLTCEINLGMQKDRTFAFGVFRPGLRSE